MASIKGKNVVVTGGAGFIGSHLVDYLIEKEVHHILVMDNFFLGERTNLSDALSKKGDLEILDLDVTKTDLVLAAFQKRNYDVVFDLATIPLPASLEKPHWASAVIYNLALSICEVARLGFVGTVVHCSSSEAYGSAQFVPMTEEHPLKVETPYAAAKAAAALLFESYEKTFKIDLTIGRPFNNYGPRQNSKDFSGIIPKVIKGIKNGQTPSIYGDGLQTRDYLFVRDTVRGLVMLYENEKSRGKTINLASGKELTVLKIIEDICACMGWKQSPRYVAARPADVRRHLAGTALAEKTLGFRPEIKWQQGIDETVRWYQNQFDRSL